MSPPHSTTTKSYHYWWCGISFLSSFPAQGRYETPLEFASGEGDAKIVALLLQAEGIDVNKGQVSIMIPTITMSPNHPTITNQYHFSCGMSFLFPFTGALWHPSRDSLGEGSYRDSGHVVTGRGD